MPPIDEEITRKLVEIEFATEKLKEDQKRLDGLIEEKIQQILKEKLSACNKSMSPDSFISNNADFMSTLRQTMKLQYEQFFKNSLTTLDAARNKLLWIRSLPAA